MTKRTRNKPTKAAPALESSGSLVDQASGLYRRLIAAVDEKITAGEVLNSTTLREVAGVMRAAATLDAEQRAQRRKDDAHAAAIPRALIVAFCRQLDDREWDLFVREVNQFRDGKGPHSALAM